MQLFNNIQYLRAGTPRQQQVHGLLKTRQLLEILHPFDPVLAGTIPLNIDVPGSDLDIICRFTDKIDFERRIVKAFSGFAGFTIADAIVDEQPTIIANFTIDGWPVEIFGQALPTHQQKAYLHMINEHLLLTHYGDALRRQVIDLKKQGYKTEPAFALALGLKGDPYQALLNAALITQIKN
jgi:hypothetical protein